MNVDEIRCGDAVRMMHAIDSDSIDLVITSPPYNLGVQYDNCDDYRSWPEYYTWCRIWLEEVYRVLKPDGRLCLNHYLSCGTAKSRSNPLMNLNAICVAIGFKEHGVALWTESSTCKRTAWGSWLSASAPYLSSPHECISVFYKDHWKKDRKGESTITKEEFMNWTLGIWKMNPERSRGGCPAPFPPELPRRCINLFSYVGDLVLDPFNGSGATTAVAQQTGRHFIGIDISDAYCEDAREWLKTGIKPKRPVLKRMDKRSRQKDLVLTVQCACGAVIEPGQKRCKLCADKIKLAERTGAAVGMHRELTV